MQYTTFYSQIYAKQKRKTPVVPPQNDAFRPFHGMKNNIFKRRLLHTPIRFHAKTFYMKHIRMHAKKTNNYVSRIFISTLSPIYAPKKIKMQDNKLKFKQYDTIKKTIMNKNAACADGN